MYPPEQIRRQTESTPWTNPPPRYYFDMQSRCSQGGPSHSSCTRASHEPAQLIQVASEMGAFGGKPAGFTSSMLSIWGLDINSVIIFNSKVKAAPVVLN